ncbi:MAG: hypothetical protein JJ863_06610 [Deltaproteobacteria bacterium]|nr:hypothetical protein [Deltaproteobacteria bacterium]
MTPENGRAVLIGIALGLVFAAGKPPAAADAPPPSAVIPVRFHVTHIGGQPAKSEEWLDEQIAWANRVFTPTGLSFRNAGVERLDGDHAVLNSRNDRNQLARYLERGVVNAFVVGEMYDVDNRDEWRRGVHWRLQWRPNQHFVILTGIAPPTTLAHELGHFFGNRMHRWVPGNIMSYEHGSSPTFDPDQLRRVEDTARQLLRTRQLFTMGAYEEMVQEGRLPAFFYPPNVRRPNSQRHRASR